MADHGDIVFSNGIDNGITSGAFIRHIRQIAMAEGRQKDDLWMAQYAAARLDGDALHWYEDQNEEVQDDWKELRKAILLKWPVKTQTSDSASVTSNPDASVASLVPTPAAAPPPPPPSAQLPPHSLVPTPPAAAALPSTTLITPSGSGSNVNTTISAGTEKRKGYLRVESVGGELIGYVSNQFDFSYYVSSSPSAAEKLLISFMPPRGYNCFSITIEAGPQGKSDSLSADWQENPVWVKGYGKALTFAYMLPYQKRVLRRVWTWIMSLQGTLVCASKGTGVDVRVLRPIMNTKSGLLLFGAFEKTNISAGQETHIDVIVVFEPLDD